MKIALAQIKPVKGDVEANLNRHLAFLETAAGYEAACLFFPELSLTGYEPLLASKLSMTVDDVRLAVLQAYSDKNDLVAAVGIPIFNPPLPRIALLIFIPHQPPLLYAKQWLHADEQPFFSAGSGQEILTRGGKRIAPAICYESLLEAHISNAVASKIDLYIACVAKSDRQLEKARVYYSSLSLQYNLPVAMVNCTGFCDNFEAVGQTSAWSRQGKLLASCSRNEEQMLLVDFEKEEAEIINISNG